MGFASGWALGQWASSGALGEHLSIKKGGQGRGLCLAGAVRDSGAEGHLPPHLQPSAAPGAFFPRNFRKHLRMVGSRRVKAQSKGAGRGAGWGLLLAAGLRGFVRCSLCWGKTA